MLYVNGNYLQAAANHAVYSIVASTSNTNDLDACVPTYHHNRVKVEYIC